jgi:hypothetical protein
MGRIRAEGLEGPVDSLSGGGALPDEKCGMG